MKAPGPAAETFGLHDTPHTPHCSCMVDTAARAPKSHTFIVLSEELNKPSSNVDNSPLWRPTLKRRVSHQEIPRYRVPKMNAQSMTQRLRRLSQNFVHHAWLAFYHRMQIPIAAWLLSKLKQNQSLTYLIIRRPSYWAYTHRMRGISVQKLSWLNIEQVDLACFWGHSNFWSIRALQNIRNARRRQR